MSFSVGGFEFTGAVLTLGVITGMTYGILAVGLVLIYRSNRIINFAHGEIGAFGAALLGVAVVEWGIPYWVAFVMAVAASALIGAFSELVVVRRLRNAPNVMSIVATLGLAQVLLLFSLILYAEAQSGRVYPQPSPLPSFDVGALRVTPAYFGMLFLTPVLVVCLALFLKRTWFGLAIRATAANPDTARVAGIFAGRMSMLAWAIAGGVSAYTAILVRPTLGFVGAETLGPGLLLRALAAAVVARMHSLPVALAAGIALGITEQELQWNYPQGGLVEMVLFGVILVGLLAQRRQTGREEEKGSWAAVEAWRPLPEGLLRVRSIRNLGKIAATVALSFALLLAWVSTNATAIILVVIISFALVGLSIGVVTGLAGQLSLGQFAIAGVAATVSYVISRETGNFVLGFGGAAGAAAAVSVLVGLPALRVRGLMLAVATLSFALASSAWLFRQGWMLGEGVDPGRPTIGSYTFESAKSYYLFSLLILAIGFWFVRNVWRGAIGRRLRAIRDNEDAARAFTLPATRVKLQGFALAGVITGLGGALYGHALSLVAATAFPLTASINVVAMAVLGGIGIVVGPLIGALYIIGVPQFLPLDSAGLAASAAGWLLLILYFPGGLARLARPLRDRIIVVLGRRAGIDPEAAQEEPVSASIQFSDAVRVGPATPKESTRIGAAPRLGAEPLLEVRGLRKSFGGLSAVSGVSFSVRKHETLGLIGPNGAGKTTLFELVSGFTKPDAGEVFFAGRNISRLGPEARGRLGLIRSFQDASLFPTFTVLDALKLAQERTAPAPLLSSALGLQRSEKRKDERARELVASMGLEPYRNKQIRELSTGTRRITELACVMALEPTLLLLDEPSSGVAQSETEALGDLLARLKDHLECTLVVIEHDMPLIMGISDRLIAMESGQIIAEGSPDVVRRDERVIESYLGADTPAIHRSGAVSATPDDRCRETTRLGVRCSRTASTNGFCAQHQARQKVRA